ncbi:phage tail spike protein [Streptococcus ruminantium]|uniref:phage tail spike protein n=1 Tax=Streptococcus ruminantium TaxID=1917441 RepID=UPI001EEDB131|nr:phage tail spike protein [Streptococcus ruminantium]BDD42627.1 hypothetical protein GUT189_09600 [Streptococcus ruminantium]
MIYLFDKDEKLFKIVNKPAIKTALQKYALTTERYVSDRLTVEMKALNDDELEKVEYMAIQTMEDAHTFHYFYVAQKSSENLTTLIGVQSGIEELRKSPVFDKRPQNAFAREVIDDLLADTNWQARFVGETTPHSTNFYYTSIFDALKKVCEVWDLEMQFFVEMNGNRIGARYIDFKQRIGEAVGKRVVYGHNALQILQEVERTNIFTALVGRGKGEETGDGYGRKITFEDVVWSRTQGKPVDKPKGQKYLELPLMTRQYGIKNADGTMRPKIGFVDFSEEENPEVLIERTYRALVDAARPQLTLKTSSVYLRGVKVGDTIRVVRHDKKLDYDTRIFEITFNRLNNQSSDIKLGDRIGVSIETKAQTIADKAIDNFVANEFSNFVQNLPDYLPSADGFNNNWYGSEDPSKKYQGKVLINDIWYKPDPEHEGHKIMLRWTGEVWEEILRTYDSEALRDRIAEEAAKVNETMKENEVERQKQIDDLLLKAGVNKSLAEEAKKIGDQAILDAASAHSKAADALLKALANSNLINETKADLQVTTDAIKALVTKKDFDATTKRLTTAETELEAQAGLIKQRLTSTEVEAFLTKNGYATSATVQNIVKQTADSFSRTISRIESQIPTSVGGTNLFKGSRDLSGEWYNLTTGSYWEEYKGVHIHRTNKVWSGKSQKINAKAGEVYTFSFYAKSDIENDSVMFYANHTNTGSPARVNLISKPISLTNEYKRYSVTFKVLDDGVIVPRIERTDSVNYLYFGGFKLESGIIATDWSPAPEDLSTVVALNEVRDTVESHTQTLTNQSGQISQVVQTAQGLVLKVSALDKSDNLFSFEKSTKGFWVDKNGSAVAGNTYSYSDFLKLTSDGSYQLQVWNKSADKKWIGITKYTTDKSYIPGSYSSFEVEPNGYRLLNFTDFNGYFIISYGSYTTSDMSGLEIQFERGLVATQYKPSNLDLATKTQVSILAGSWAVQNLTNSGTILNQLNLNKDGSVKIDGKLVQITGTTYIQDGVIKSAKIAGLDAGKIKTGTLDAGNVNIINLNANKLVGLDANFIKSKIELAIIDWMKGKTIVAQNNGMTINLNSSDISFHNAQAAIKRQKNGVTGYLNFQDDRYGGVYAALGVTSHSVGIVAEGATNYGKFAGVEVYRPNDSVDKIRIVGDRVKVTHGANASAFIFRPANMERGADVDMNNIVNAVRALSMSIHHLAANNFIFTQGVKDQINRLRSYMNGIGETYL